MFRILLYKSSALNHSLFYFGTKAIKLSLKTVTIFLFLQLSIILFLNDQTVVLSVKYSGKSINSLKEIQSIDCFSISMFEKTFFCCEASILKMTLISSLDLPLKIVLLKYMESKMIRKGFQSIKRLDFEKFVSN